MANRNFSYAPPTSEPNVSEAYSQNEVDPSQRKPPQRVTNSSFAADPILTVDDVARRLNVTKDWVWDHSSRKTPRLPVIRMGDGTLRYRSSAIEDFISERERLSAIHRGRR